MAVHVTCPQCKQRIPFGRLFCTNCGAKLEINSDTITSRTSAGEVLTRARRIVIRLVVLAIVLGAVGLFLWPMQPTGRTGDASYEKLCQQRMDAVRARVLNGMQFSETFSDIEINAWLASRMAATTSKDVGAGFRLTAVNVALNKEGAVVATISEAGPVRLSVLISGKPQVSANNGFAFEVTGVRVGHVPLPSALHDFFADRNLTIFANFREQHDVLNKMRKLETKDGQVVLSNQNQ